ncbi:MAG TPA: aminotransferase DegT [Betaproteobacteria bacterium]|nr:aminotransferase DegT [Betaproteobacteria bacterium]
MADFLPFPRPAIDEETIAGVAEVLRSGWITSGPQVKAFEAALSAYFGGRPVLALNSGTAALEVALRLCGVGPGDEVITAPLSWAATANVILAVGATPVFADIHPATRNIDLECVEAALTSRTRAILPVDLAGLPVDRERLYALAEKHRLRVVEDAAQSMGASWRGRRIGAFGDLTAISFHANKNLTTGEGGCLILSDAAQRPLAEKLRLQGVVRFPDGTMDVDVAGGKFNLTDIAARIGLGQLKQIDHFNARRRELAQDYFDCFDRSLGCELPPENFDDSNWHMFQILLPLARLRIGRGEFIDRMRQRNIGVGVHYPPIHLFTLYRDMGWREGDFPHAERVGRAIATLPLFPAMTRKDVERVCAAITEIINETTR